MLGKQRKSRHFQPAVCIGETNAINLELFLAPDYYQTTMERYEEIIKAKLFKYINTNKAINSKNYSFSQPFSQLQRQQSVLQRCSL